MTRPVYGMRMMAKSPSSHLAIRFGRTGFDRATNLLAFLLIAVVFLALRINLHASEITPDEFIVEAVTRHMHDHHSLDGNWINAESMPDAFRYDQFNFYSYHLVSFLVLKIFGFANAITTLRFENVALQAIAVATVASAMSRQGCDRWQLIAVAALLALSPALVEDAHVARAESLLYCLLAVALWCATLESAASACAGIGLVVGFGMASKVTFLATAIVALPVMVSAGRERLAAAASLAVVVALCALLGFVAGAPAVPFHIAAYLNGLDALSQQYNLGQPPHSPPNFTVISQFTMVMRFILILQGPILLGLVPVLWRWKLDWLAGLALMAAFIIVYFACVPVFFERNIGLASMALAIVCGALATSYRSMLIPVTTGLVMSWWSVQIAAASDRFNERRVDWEIAHVGRAAVEWPDSDVVGTLQTCQGIYGVSDYGDPYSIAMRRDAEAAGFVPFAHYRSVFHVVPTSTLQTYLDSDVDYYRCGHREPSGAAVEQGG